MKRLVPDYAVQIQKYETERMPLRDAPGDPISLNICRNCITGSAINDITLWDHLLVQFTNVHNISAKLASMRAKSPAILSS